MIIACQREMTPANILVQPPDLKTPQIIQYSNQENQNSLTQRIIPQLHCVRKLLFHETEKFIFAILKLLTPLNIASMIMRNDTSQHSGSTSVSKNVTNHTIFQPRKSELFDMKNHSSITLSQKTLIS